MKDMKEIRWFHSMELEPGLHTISPAETEKLRKRERAYLDKVDLKGKSVLDVGAWDGYYSIAAKKRGAARVLATDWVCWHGPSWGNKDGFDYAKAKSGFEIEEKAIDVPDISVESVGTFDVVFFMGVFYHLRHPLLGLERVAKVAKETLIVETALDKKASWLPWPMMTFYPGAEMAGDPTNWWGPNVPLMLALLKDCGFRDVSWGKCPVWPKRAYFVARR
jgi:tRNA (mo5U34)-methyltransferase